MSVEWNNTNSLRLKPTIKAAVAFRVFVCCEEEEQGKRSGGSMWSMHAETLNGWYGGRRDAACSPLALSRSGVTVHPCIEVQKVKLDIDYRVTSSFKRLVWFWCFSMSSADVMYGYFCRTIIITFAKLRPVVFLALFPVNMVSASVIFCTRFM